MNFGADGSRIGVIESLIMAMSVAFVLTLVVMPLFRACLGETTRTGRSYDRVTLELLGHAVRLVSAFFLTEFLIAAFSIPENPPGSAFGGSPPPANPQSAVILTHYLLVATIALTAEITYCALRRVAKLPITTDDPDNGYRPPTGPSAGP